MYVGASYVRAALQPGKYGNAKCYVRYIAACFNSAAKTSIPMLLMLTRLMAI